MKRIGLMMLFFVVAAMLVRAIDKEQADQWKPVLDALFPDLPAPWVLDKGKSRFTVLNATVIDWGHVFTYN